MLYYMAHDISTSLNPVQVIDQVFRKPSLPGSYLYDSEKVYERQTGQKGSQMVLHMTG